MEDPEQTRQKQEKLRKHPQKASSFLSHLFFWWPLRLILRGRNNEITEDNLYEPLDDHQSKKLGEALHQLWSEEEKKKSPSLARALFRLIAFKFLVLGIISTVNTFLSMFLLAFFLEIILDFFVSNQTEISLNQAMFAASMFLLMSFLRSIGLHIITLELNTLGLKLKVASSGLIYRKALQLKTGANVGQMVNLLSNDVNRFQLSLTFLHHLWVSPLSLLLGAAYLDITLGHAAVTGLVFIILSVLLLVWMAKKLEVVRKTAAEKTDHRVRLMNDVIVGMQAIKFYTWEQPYVQMIQAARREEMGKMVISNEIRFLNFTTRMYVSKISVFVSVVVASFMGFSVTSRYVFVMLNLYENLRLVAVTLLQFAILFAAETKVSVQRIQEFLLQCGNPTAKPSCGCKIRLTNVSARWNQHHVLTQVSFSASPGEVVGVVGRAGSGKSTLLHVILQEVATTGDVHVEGRLSYASQEPWIFSASIKQNILFGEEFDHRKYSTVLQVCALEHDLAQLLHGDQTRVGERGVMLSGGQKARISLARAVYRDADIYLLDDPLSAVDAHVAAKIFAECVCGYLARKCVVLVTHQVHFLKGLHSVFIVENGRVVRKDTKEADLEECQDIQPEEAVVKNHEMQSEMKEHRSKTSASAIYVNFFRASGSSSLVFIMLFLFFFSQVFNSAIDCFITLWTNVEDGVLTLDPTFFTLKTMLLIYSGLLLLLIITTHVANFIFVLFCKKVSINLHDKMLKRIINATTTFFHQHASGRVLNRFTKDMGVIDELIPVSLMTVMVNFLNFLGVIIIVIYSNYWIALPAVVVFTVVGIFSKIFVPTNHSVKRTEGTTRSALFTHLSASMEGLTTIRAFGAQTKITEEFDRHQDLHTSSSYLFFAVFAGFSFWNDMVCIVFNGLVVFSFFLLKNLPAAGNVGLAITQSTSILGNVPYTLRALGELESYMISVERVEEYSQVDVEDGGEAAPPPKDWPRSGTLTFTGVSLKYHNLPVLKSVSFQVNSGEKIGIVGRTGAGKTSLISTLFRLFDFTGSVRIDGVNTKSVSLNTLRSKMSIIPQEPVLFMGSLRKNIDPFDDYRDEQIWKCLEETELKTAVSGLDANVSERGGNFSVGQRQLICLVRALLKNNRIVVLDEATANVDLKTDELIQRTIRRKFKNCTVLTIAHRLNTVIDSDKILVMEDGRVVEFEHPFVLLRKRGRFYEYVKECGEETMGKFLEAAEKSYKEH